MESAKDISLIPLATPGKPPRGEVLAAGRSTGTVVNGAVLEAAFHAGDRFLLLTTDDIPLEDQLHIILLDRQFHILDWATIGGMYSTGQLRHVVATESNLLQFRFIGDTIWTVQLFDVPVRHLPFLSDPRGVTRPLRLTRHFGIKGTPRPDLGPSNN